jgi:hypothetical protein
MKQLYQDSEGKVCAAKVAFMSTMATSLGTVIYNTYMAIAIDYTGIAALIGAAGAIYYGRSNTKANAK